VGQVETSAAQEGRIVKLKYFEEYGFIRGGAGDYYFRKLDLLDPAEWPFLRHGSVMGFELGGKGIEGRLPPAKRVRLLRQMADTNDAAVAKTI